MRRLLAIYQATRAPPPPHSRSPIGEQPPLSLVQVQPADAKILPAAPPMSDHSGGGRDGDEQQQQRQCRRGVAVDVVELGAALALADMAGAAAGKKPAPQLVQLQPTTTTTQDEDEEMATTRLSLQLGNNVSIIQSSSCSSSGSSVGRPAPPPANAPAPAPSGYGPKPRHMLTEEEKEAKRLRRVLANRESARQTILRRQAIRDELARKVADLSTQNESMKKERETVMQEYLSLKETNKQLKEQAQHHLSLSLF